MGSIIVVLYSHDRREGGMTICSVHACNFLLIMFAGSTVRDENVSEAQALRSEVKQCTAQVEKLSSEFKEIKKDIEAARKEVDNTLCTLTEITVKLLSTN